MGMRTGMGSQNPYFLFDCFVLVCLFVKRPAVVTQVCNPGSGEVRTVPSEAQERLSQRRGVLT